MLDRFKNAVVTLRLLVLPNSSAYFMLDRCKNPVVALELSKRYKNKAYVMVVHAVYAVYGVYSFLVLARTVTEGGNIYRSQWVFNDLLGSTVLPVVGMIFLVVPVLAAVSVVGERRRGTLMPVQLSSLRPFDIVWGKVVASVAPVLFPVVVCVVALVAFSLSLSMKSLLLGMKIENVYLENVYRLFGSVFVGAGLVVLSVAVSVACVLCSTFAKSSASAIAMSYGLFFSMIFVVPLVESVFLRSRSVSLWVGIVGIVGLPFWCLWACRRLRLPAKK